MMRVGDSYNSDSEESEPEEARLIRITDLRQEERKEKYQRDRKARFSNNDAKLKKARWKLMPHRRSMYTYNTREEIEYYRQNVNVFCRSILGDERQKPFYGLIQKRKQQVNRMTCEELRLEQLTLKPPPILFTEGKEYVLHSPNSLYLGLHFEQKWHAHVIAHCYPLVITCELFKLVLMYVY